MRREWMGHALCREVDTDLFFPEHGGNPRQAVRVCRECPVQEDCLSYALSIGPVHGVWGGTTETERRRMRYAA